MSGFEFRALPRLATTDVVDIVQVAGARILRYFERRGIKHVDLDADGVLSVPRVLDRDRLWRNGTFRATDPRPTERASDTTISDTDRICRTTPR